MQMKDLEVSKKDLMDGDAFANLATSILDRLGEDEYADEWVRIVRNHNGLDLEIQRRAQDVDDADPKIRHLGTNNPTTMVKKGEVIRHHGEYVYLTAHMWKVYHGLTA